MCSFFKKHLCINFFNLMLQKQTFVYNHKRLLSVISPSRTDVPIQLKGRLASNEQKRIITECIIESDPTKLDWSTLKKSVLSIKRGQLNDKNINGCILDTCAKQKRLDLTKSFMKYLKECGQTKHNLSLELLYFRSCYASQNQLSVDDKKEIQANCQLLFNKNSHLLNTTFLEGIVMGLCCTPAWRDSLEYLKVLEHHASIQTYICIILKAFEEKDEELGWTLTYDIFNQHGVLPLEIFQSWFNLCEKNINFNYQRVLEFLRDCEGIIRIDLAELIHEKCKQFGNKVATTMILHSNGKCKNCKQHLKSVNVTDSEFKELQELFIKNVMIGNNVFNNSTPQEMKNFQDFIEMTAPYDVVVDGLNLAYAYRGKIANSSLTKVVMNKFINQKMKVLLIGRKHLVDMLGKEYDFIQNNVHIFFTSDLSKDDPFVLYAAMYSGLGTKILTRDLMRSHRFLLKDAKMKNLFQKWLQKHRLSLKLRPGNEVIIKNPITYLQMTQKSNDGTWHVPYQEPKESGSWSKPDSSPDNWMCIQKRS